MQKAHRKPLHRRLREWRLLWNGLRSTEHPVQVHMVPMRRCNLACGYCNEYDDHSKPVPLEEMKRRVDHLARLGTSLVTISGGEPLLHPELDDIIRHIRSHGMLAGCITNGYLLVKERIERLNQAGLDYLQISIDNVQPDEVSVKSLKVLDKKLELLSEWARFNVNINSVLGSGVQHPEDALTIAQRAVHFGFISTVGIIHDGHGQLRPLSPEESSIYQQVKRLGKRSFARLNKFQDNITQAKANRWKCRAGSRYLYICENGLVHYCSQQRGHPGVALAEYTIADIRREYRSAKSCAPYCTVACVHYTSMMDFWRDEQRPPEGAAREAVAAGLIQIK
ncbi:MAG TPA: radical SAM protein [Terriglobales bacterium]|nr:radical SAM protein [Terriglobales bacterium]